MSVVDGSFDNSLRLEEKASGPLAGGILNHGFQCGMLWGASLAAGAEAYRRLGSGPKAETGAVLISQRLVDKFRARTGNKINCIDLIGLDMKNSSGVMKFLLKGGPIGCMRIIASYTPEAFSEIDSALEDEDIKAAAPPVSCASLVAKKMGASDEQAVMAAGFAGGIGLSGGACGALGAAMWMTVLNSSEDWTLEVGSTIPEGQEVIDRFVEASDCEFECCDIVGRLFENIGDHANYIRAGGCAVITEALATPDANIEHANP